MKLGIVGATGLVGQNFLKLLEQETSLKIDKLKLFSRQSKPCSFLKQKIMTEPLSREAFAGLDICFFSAGEAISREWAPQVQEQGGIVIDNSSAFRLDPDKYLVVPEVNAHGLQYKPQIIANPNCSTIQLVVPLQALEKAFGLLEVQVVSLQSISGAGSQALESLKQDSQEILSGEKPYKSPSLQHAFNCVPFIGEINEDGFCKEEAKIMAESRKILNLPDLKISAWTVRVPCLNSHSEVVRFSLKKSPDREQVLKALEEYVVLLDPPPHARQADQEKEVFVGRVHQDPHTANTWWMWVVSDNLLKGASWNGLQIAKDLIQKKPEAWPKS